MPRHTVIRVLGVLFMSLGFATAATGAGAERAIDPQPTVFRDCATNEFTFSFDAGGVEDANWFLDNSSDHSNASGGSATSPITYQASHAYDKAALWITHSSGVQKFYADVSSCDVLIEMELAQPRPITIHGTIAHVFRGQIAGAEICVNDTCQIAADGTFSIYLADRGDGEFQISVSAEGYQPGGGWLSLGDYEGEAFESEYFLILEGHYSGHGAYDPNAIVGLCTINDATTVQMTVQELLSQEYAYFNTAFELTLYETTAEIYTLGACSGGGHSGPQPVDGSYNDPETGNSFEFLTAMRMCADNSLDATFTGMNVVSVDFTVYNPNPGWGTDWLSADAESGRFTTPVENEGAYFVDAGVRFDDDTVVIVKVSIPNCTETTPPSDDIPDAGIGDSRLVIQLNLVDDEDVSGAPFNLYAPMAAIEFSPTPLLSGTVGTNNAITVDGLIPGPYRVVVYPEGSDPISAVVEVTEKPITQAIVTVNAAGDVEVTYPDDAPAPGPGDVPAPGDIVAPDIGTDAPAKAVTGLPETGTGSGFSNAALLLATTATVVLAAGLLVVRSNRF